VVAHHTNDLCERYRACVSTYVRVCVRAVCVMYTNDLCERNVACVSTYVRVCVCACYVRAVLEQIVTCI